MILKRAKVILNQLQDLIQSQKDFANNGKVLWHKQNSSYDAKEEPLTITCSILGFQQWIKLTIITKSINIGILKWSVADMLDTLTRTTLTTNHGLKKSEWKL